MYWNKRIVLNVNGLFEMPGFPIPLQVGFLFYRLTETLLQLAQLLFSYTAKPTRAATIIYIQYPKIWYFYFLFYNFFFLKCILQLQGKIKHIFGTGLPYQC